MSIDMPNQQSGRIFFNYVLIIFALIAVTFGVGKILFQWIDEFFVPQEELMALRSASQYEFFKLKQAIAGIIIGLPTLMLATINLRRKFRNKQLDSNNTIRSWMIYIIMSVAGVTFLFILWGLVYDVLSGEYDLKQVLRYLTVLGITGSVIGYYQSDLKDPLHNKHIFKHLLNYGLIGLMSVALVLGVFMVPSPVDAKKMKSDESTRNQINQIVNTVNEYYHTEKKLPPSLQDLIGKGMIFEEDAKNKDTNEAFSYKPLGEKSYEICGAFNFDYKGYNPKTSNKAGAYCFKREVTEY
jgi:competence protein ComGC